MLKVKCFGCSELGYYVNQCPNQMKDNKGKQTTTSTKIENLSSRLEDEFELILDVSLGGGV